MYYDVLTKWTQMSIRSNFQCGKMIENYPCLQYACKKSEKVCVCGIKRYIL